MKKLFKQRLVLSIQHAKKTAQLRGFLILDNKYF